MEVGDPKKIRVMQHTQEHNDLTTVLPFETVSRAFDFVKEGRSTEILEECFKFGFIHWSTVHLVRKAPKIRHGFMWEVVDLGVLRRAEVNGELGGAGLRSVKQTFTILPSPPPRPSP